MKVRTLFSGILAGVLAIMMIVSFTGCSGKSAGQISLSGAFALYPMAVKWAEEYNILYPDVRIDISAGGAGKGISDVLSGMVDIGMVSREVYTEEISKGAFPIAVTKDAVVAVVNANNPSIETILATGLKNETGNAIWIEGSIKTWQEAIPSAASEPLRVYTRSDACGAAEMWAKCFDRKQEDLIGTGVFGDPGLAEAVQKDPLGIGYNNIGYAYDAVTKNQVEGLKVVPLDLNNNGTIDEDEDFYDSMYDLIAAIAAGKYPSPPARELYFVTLKNPSENTVLTHFINWVLTDGQKYVREAGYINLPEEKIAAEQEKIK